MKKILIPVLSLGLFTSLAEMRAQDPAGPASYAAVQQVHLAPQQLEELVAPIALYPDPLIALILPASTVPTDVVMAARYLKNGGDVNSVDVQNWDPSVKSLTRYPDALNMMDENLDWTNQLGTAVIAQQGDVMQAIQNQRAKANALGNLSSTPQQQVVVEKQIIQIVPADPEIIDIPHYNPEVVYIERAPAYSPFITFGAGFAMGVWLTNDCDWNHRGFYVNNWGRNGWHGYPRYNNVNININQNNYWRPNAYRPPPRPPYVPNRVSASNQQNIPAFRQPPQGGWNGNNNRAQANPGNRPAAVTPGVANQQARPGRTNSPSPVNPFPSNPVANSSGNNRPQTGANPSQPAAAANPGSDQKTRPGSWGNNGQTSREDGRKNPSPANVPATVSIPNPGRPVAQQVKTDPQTAATSAPRPVATPNQPVATPKNSPWKNPQQTQVTPQTQQRRNPAPVFNSAPEQKRPVQQPSGNSQNQPRTSPPRPTVSPRPQQQKSAQPQRQQPQPPAGNAPQSRQQNLPQGTQDQGQQDWQRRR